MTTVATRKRRGAKSQDIVAEWFQPRGFPHADSAGAGRRGVDVTNMAGISCEVKARRGFSPKAWIKQARAKPGLAIVVIRPDGMGPASIADWPVMLRLEDLTVLLREAGYGEPEPTLEVGGSVTAGTVLNPC